MRDIAVLDAGMVTSVGLSARATCAAIRAGISNFAESGFLFDGEPLMGAMVQLPEPWRGREKLMRMAASAVAECLTAVGSLPTTEIPLLLCLAEEQRPGRLDDLDASFLRELGAHMGVAFHRDSVVITQGRLAGVEGLERARFLLERGRRFCIVAGADSYLVGPTLAWVNGQRRLLTAANSDGFVPGEAGAALLLGSGTEPRRAPCHCRGIGRGTEPASFDAGKPLRGEGMAAAIRAALADAGCTFEHLQYRIGDLSGPQYGFKEATLAMFRTVRPVKQEFAVWHPVDCIGEVGAAMVPCVVGIALYAVRGEYAPGPGVLCHFSGDDTSRAALVLQRTASGSTVGVTT